MIVGAPKEIKDKEYRVSLVPAGVLALTRAGHRVLVQRDAGLGSGIADEEYATAGAEIVGDAEEVFARSDMIVKVKEPQPAEVAMLRPEQVLFTYLHLAPDAELTQSLLDSGAICIAYETIEDARGELPLLTPMSEVAGRMSIQVGAHFLEKTRGGGGILLGGVPGVPPAKVVVLGGGTVGIQAAKIAVGMGAHVTVLEVSAARMRYLDDVFAGRVATLMSNRYYIEHELRAADLIIGAVLVHGAAAPRLVTRDMLPAVKDGAVIVDVAVDQGGCIETTRPTTHSAPTYVIDGVVHYAVANMPGAVPQTSTRALTNVTLPYVVRIASSGVTEAVRRDRSLALGVNVWRGELTCEGVATSQGRDYRELAELL